MMIKKYDDSYGSKIVITLKKKMKKKKNESDFFNVFYVRSNGFDAVHHK